MTLIATAGSGGEFLPLANLLEAESETSRCLLLELRSDSSCLQLKKHGQWELEGPAMATSLYDESDGFLGLITASRDGNLIVQNVNLKPTKEAIGDNQSNGNHTHGHISIPHAIKSIISGSTETEHPQSSEKPSLGNAKEPSASLSESRNVGLLIEGARPLGMTMRRKDNRTLRGVVWFHKEMAVSSFAKIIHTIDCHTWQVFDFEEGSMRYTLRHPAADVQDASWLDEDLFALCFKVFLVNVDASLFLIDSLGSCRHLYDEVGKHR